VPAKAKPQVAPHKPTQLSCFSRDIKRGREELATAHNENVTLHSTHSARTHPRPMYAAHNGEDEIGLRRVSVVRVRDPLASSLCGRRSPRRSYHNRVPDTHLFLPRVRHQPVKRPTHHRPLDTKFNPPALDWKMPRAAHQPRASRRHQISSLALPFSGTIWSEDNFVILSFLLVHFIQLSSSSCSVQNHVGYTYFCSDL
jgi:hypothetical protein